ncbi:MAG: 4Fe-4S binding protein [Candidatus Bathyarchaeia archaeon]
MQIDRDLCVGCGICIPWCPVGAISLSEDRKAVIDLDRCVECWICYRAVDCPMEAVGPPGELKPPRDLMWNFACPTKDWTMTRMAGRGTEEMKTNEVTGRFKFGEVGFGVELGRPGISTTFNDIEKVTKAVASCGVEFEPNNPVTLMIDAETGRLKDESLRRVRVLSVVLEFKSGMEKAERVLKALQEASKEVDTVMSVSVINRVNLDGSIPILKTLEKMGIPYRPNMKVNVGLGRTSS